MRADTALFVTHTATGRLKPHVRHYLASLRKQNVACILIVAADGPFADGDDALLADVDGLFVRENTGYDFAAWAHVVRLVPNLLDIETLYFVNDSLVGPFNDDLLASVIDRIRTSSSDVLGLTDNYEIRWHVQSFFLAFQTESSGLGGIPAVYYQRRIAQ